MNKSETPLDIYSNASSVTQTPNRTKIVLMAFIAILVTNGLIVTCWGWADWRGFFAHPARCVVVALIFRSATGAVAGVACAILFLTRIPREEALMAREFGEAWITYARRTKRLLPGSTSSPAQR